MMKKFVYLLILLMSALTAGAQVFTPAEMPNVQVADRRQYVSDPAHLLNDAAKSEVNARLAELRAKTSVEMVVALPPEIGDEEPSQWCEQLFTLWKIGKSDKDNGVLLMISPGSRATFIMTGYGVEGVLTDIACNNIVNRAIIPAMRDDDLAKAVLQATSLVYDALTDPAVADELRSAEPDNFSGAMQTIDARVLVDFIKIVALLLFLASLVLFINDAVKARRLDSNHARALRWKEHLPTYLWMGILSAGAGLVFWLLALFMYRSWRNRPLKCSTCGHKMHRLSEEEDNELLSAPQDLEEQLNTVDYDVWECPDCGTVERYPYKIKQKNYTECPNCHTVAMGLDSDVVVQKPTTRSAGRGVKTYECKFCHHRKQKNYVIPKKEDVGAIAAGAALGAMSGRGRGGFGGGGFGGGFGGGATGGGGAGGRW